MPHTSRQVASSDANVPHAFPVNWSDKHCVTFVDICTPVISSGDEITSLLAEVLGAKAWAKIPGDVLSEPRFAVPAIASGEWRIWASVFYRCWNTWLISFSVAIHLLINKYIVGYSSNVKTTQQRNFDYYLLLLHKWKNQIRENNLTRTKDKLEMSHEVFMRSNDPVDSEFSNRALMWWTNYQQYQDKIHYRHKQSGARTSLLKTVNYENVRHVILEELSSYSKFVKLMSVPNKYIGFSMNGVWTEKRLRLRNCSTLWPTQQRTETLRKHIYKSKNIRKLMVEFLRKLENRGL